MSLEGRVIVSVAERAGQVQGVSIEPPRPIALAPVLGGKPVAAAVGTIGALFSVCAMAQSTAAVEAVETACGLFIDPRTRAARRLLVLAESLREHLLYICREQQQVTGAANNAVTLRRVAALPARLKQALFPDRDPFMPGVRIGAAGPQVAPLLDEAGDLVASIIGRVALANLTADEFQAWANTGTTLAARLAASLRQRGLAEIGVPTDGGDGLAGDSSCLARQAGEPLLCDFLERSGGPSLMTRFAARFVEAAGLPGRIASGLSGLPLAEAGDRELDGIVGGTATVAIDAARGRLQHRVVVRQGVIACYEITAPTSVHFASDGIAVRSISTLAAGSRDALAVQIDLMLRSIDPCVAFEVRYR